MFHYFTERGIFYDVHTVSVHVGALFLNPASALHFDEQRTASNILEPDGAVCQAPLRK